MGKHSKPKSRRAARTLSTAAAIGGLTVTSQGSASAAAPVMLTGGPVGGWTAIVKCESNFNPKAQNDHSSASGLFQFVDQTWLENGGSRYSRHAKGATIAQQNIVANRTFARYGLKPWISSEACWGPKMTAADRKSQHAAPAPVVAAPTYTVKPGDSLASIAARSHVLWQQLWAANKQIANPARIRPGQQIRLLP